MNQHERTDCFRKAIRWFGRGRSFKRYCDRHGDCDLWSAIEGRYFINSFLIKEFAFVHKKQPSDLTIHDVGTAETITWEDGSEIQEVCLEREDFTYVTWDYSRPSHAQRPTKHQIPVGSLDGSLEKKFWTFSRRSVVDLTRGMETFLSTRQER